MSERIERPVSASEFPESAPAANPVFYRTYSRVKADGTRETWEDVCKRTVYDGLVELGKLTEEEAQLIYEEQLNLRSLTSGRWLWVGGTDWAKKPTSFSGCYNCTSTNIIDWESFGLMMDLAMQGSGTGAMLEEKYISQLPPIQNNLNVTVKQNIGEIFKAFRKEETNVSVAGNDVLIEVGDSRQGWVKAYQTTIELAADTSFSGIVNITVDLGNVRPAGEKLKGFGGVSNPIKLPDLFPRLAKILNRAVGRQINYEEACLLVDEAAITIVAGNIRRSAGMRMFDETARLLKENLWVEVDGQWKIDPDRDALRMANHTRVFHRKPSLEECVSAVGKQFFSGEGAIQYAPEAIARSNADILDTPQKKQAFLDAYSQNQEKGAVYLKSLQEMSDESLNHRLERYGLNPCGEILGSNFHCNLGEVHLNQLDPLDFDSQKRVFTAAGTSVSVLLNHEFAVPRYQESRLEDPIVGVSFTGLFDFFVKAFGVDWLKWWEAGRPKVWSSESYDKTAKMPQSEMFLRQEKEYLQMWKGWVRDAVWNYCDKHGLNRPNRYTTVQPAGCADRTALRIFDQGLIYADEVVSPGSGETKGLDMSVRNGVPVNTAIANAPLELVKVTFKNGRILRITPNHRLAIDGEWVQAADMTPGMAVEFSIGEYRNTQEALLLTVNPENYTRETRLAERGHSLGLLSKTVTTPATMTPDLGYFLGAMFGNGCVSKDKSRIRFSHENLEVLNRIRDIGQRLFGISGFLGEDSRGGKYELCFASVQLFDWLKLNGLGKDAKSKDLDRIPLAIRKSSRETILSFFAGLIDTDGSPRSGTFSIDMAAEAFLRNLQQVGEAVGLCFSIFTNTKGKNFQAEKRMFGLCFSRMMSNVDAIDYLNANSIKCKYRPIQYSTRFFKFNPYEIASVEFETTPDYSYDFAVEGVDDDDSWYWQGGIKSHNTKSLLTNASSGWHPPKAQRFIRRITFRKDDPVALACIDYGYSVVPSQSDKDDEGNLLNDPFDPRVTEWLVEIPTEVPWANLPGADQININGFSAVAQFDFYMQVQKWYVGHNTSATIELTQEEVEPLAEAIYNAIQNDDGYISAALLARFNAPYPRLPFEAIDKKTYEKLQAEVLERRKVDDFHEALGKYDKGDVTSESGSSACDSDKCLFPLAEKK